MHPGISPTLGRIVLFNVNPDAATKLNSIGGRKYNVGDKVPAMVVRPLDNNACNLTLFPDAEEIMHLSAIPYSSAAQPGTWSWLQREGEAEQAAA